MSDEDIRNTLIVEVNGQTGLGSKLQGLMTLDIVAIGLGVDPARVLPQETPPLAPPPAKLQFRLRGFNEYNSTDSGAQGASDEIYLSAQGVGSAAIPFNADGTANPTLIDAPVVGDISNDNVRGPWAQQPFVLMKFDFTARPEWSDDGVQGASRFMRRLWRWCMSMSALALYPLPVPRVTPT